MPAERIRDHLAALSLDMEDCDGLLYCGGLICCEAIREPLQNSFDAVDTTIPDTCYCGGALLSEKITVYLKGGNDLGD